MIPQPKLRYVGCSNKSIRGIWMLLLDFLWEGHKVPAGFLTDGGSIPRLFLWYLNPTGKFFPCFIVHDYLYTTHLISRYRSDLLLKRLMKIRGASQLEMDAAFLAVRAFGGGSRSWDAPNPTLEDCI